FSVTLSLVVLCQVIRSLPFPYTTLFRSYPCQPFSNAGKRRGTDDPRHIWPWIARAIGILRPRFVVLENVAAHVRRGFDVVSEDQDRKSTRLNSSHVKISYAVFCLKKKNV